MEIRRSFDAGVRARLYVCSTPIGNLQDVTERVLQTLREADVVAAEDTRHTRKLLAHFDIHPPVLISLHEHNQRNRAEQLVQWWSEGLSVAIVSDAGTPLVSDPGATAVQAAIDHGVPVVPVPGANAALAALVASGLPAQPYAFLGFPPRGERECAEWLQGFRSFPGSLVLYEAPHRLRRTLERVRAELSNRKAVLAKELTKVHETFVYGDLNELCQYAASEPPRGEYVLVVGPPAEEVRDEELPDDARRLAEAVQRVREGMAQGLSRAQAVRIAAERTGLRRNEVYRAALEDPPEEDHSGP
ncbi:MAG: 16S rRNA (cytidine(1402)-2'-O)-methyltransferase [Alicyclobacillus sp.]|nr:16S rRNA (cytidine(1402)-2'-O)-methyltransferase [Alicyclobacillus sp.]